MSTGAIVTFALDESGPIKLNGFNDQGFGSSLTYFILTIFHLPFYEFLSASFVVYYVYSILKLFKR